jgi:peptidoglycan/xylan/chitin deacetylase (PgdA/CDA1 family)
MLSPFLRSLVLVCIVLLMTAAFLYAAESQDDLLIRHGTRKLPQVALTFDLCQVPSRPAGFDRRLVEILEQMETPATFFVGGDWLRTHRAEGELLSRNARFEFGNHSWDHQDLRKLDAAAIQVEVEKTEALLVEVFGSSSQLFRLPFGYYDDRVLQELKRLAVQVIQWDVVSGDPDSKLNAQKLVRGVLGSVHNGSIIIMHANGRGWHTAEALPEIIQRLQARGFQFVTVSQLLSQKGPINSP